MIRFIIFMFSFPVIFQALNYLLKGLLARPIMEFLGVEAGAMAYPGLILAFSLVIDYFLLAKVFFRGQKGTETIIHDDPPAEEAKKKEVPAEVKEFKEDKFEEVSFLDEAKEVKPDERLVFVQDFEKDNKKSQGINTLVKWLFIGIVLVWAVVATAFAYKVYNDFYMETMKTRQIVEEALYKNEFGEEREFDFEDASKYNFQNIMTDDSQSGLEINRKLREQAEKEAEETLRNMKIEKMMEQEP